MPPELLRRVAWMDLTLEVVRFLLEMELARRVPPSNADLVEDYL